MTVQYVGGMTIGDALPGVQAPLIAAIGDIQARLTALLEFKPNLVPPSLTADIQANAEILANLKLSLALGVTPPSLDVQASIMLDAVALLKAQLAIILALFDLFRAGIHVYNYTGQANALGADFTAALASGVPGGAGTDAVDGLLLIAAVPAAWAAIAQLFKTTP